MSTIRDPAYITNAGRTMMTAGGEVTYTKAVLYGQDISGLSDSQIKALTSLGNPLREVKIGVSDKQSSDSGSTVILEAVFQNNDLKVDLQYKAVGFFARKNDVEQLVIVAVANQGAYLAATNPDGVATDALDLKIAVKIGDATSVTAVIDPAGSVTPATLNGAINKLDHDLTAKIDTKADKTTVESELAIKANSTDVDKKLATKANSSDVYTKKQVDDAFSSRDATIATKADKATVDAEISKIDFTPYAKTADVNKEIKTVTDLANTKVDATYSYSKAELDKKLLALSTDTSGKVDANQVATMIEGKADKADLDKQIKAVNDAVATKADKATVDAEISKIDFTPYAKTVDVDAKVKTVTDLANQLNNNKADKSNTYTKTDVDSKVNEAKSTAQSSANQIWGEVNNLNGTNTRNDAVDVNTLEGIANKVTVYRLTNGNNKNTPSWIGDHRGVMIVLNYDGNAKTQIWTPVGTGAKDSTGTFGWRYWEGENPPAWNRFSSLSYVDARYQNALPKSGGNMNLGSNINWSGGGINDRTGNLGGLYWSGGSDTASIYGDQNANDNLDLVFDLGDDGSNHFSFRNKGGEVAAIRSNGHYTGTVDWGNVWGRPDVTPIVNGAASDDLFAFKSNQIRLYPGNGKNCKNLPPASNTQWFTVQYVFENPNGDGVAIFRSPANEVWMVGNNGGSYTTGWTRLANSGDIDRLQSIINQQNQTIQSLTTRLTNAENEIRYIKANYVEGRTFPASQEAQANSWENENPQRIAFIER